jgi:hypothetical protein
LVIGITTPLLLVHRRWGNFDISATTVKILLVLDGVLKDQRLAFVAERRSLRGDIIPSVIRGGSKPCKILLVIPAKKLT